MASLSTCWVLKKNKKWISAGLLSNYFVFSNVAYIGSVNSKRILHKHKEKSSSQVFGISVV